LLDSAYLAGLLDPFRQAASGAMPAEDRAGVHYSTDTRPRELFLNLAREARAASGADRAWLRWAGRLSPMLPWLALAGLLALLLAAAIGARRGGRANGWPARFGIPVLLTGFAGAAVTVLGAFVYQVRFGSVYSAVTMLVVCFMAGTTAGGWLGNRLASGRRAAGRLFAAAEKALALAALLLVPLAAVGPPAAIAAVLFLAGAAVGSEFPLAASARAGSTGSRLGTVTGLDLAGGAAGSVLVAALFVPAIGLVLTAVLVALVKVGSLVGRLAAGRGD
jgi:hypothetical protein